MGNKTDKNLYTVLFSVVLVVVVGSLLAFTAQFLKPVIEKNKRWEKEQNILYAMGVNNNEPGSVIFVPTAQVDSEFEKYIKQQLVLDNSGNVLKIVEGGKIVKDYSSKVKYDYGTDVYLMDIKKDKAEAGNDPSKRHLPLFIGEKDGKKFYIAPVYGKGLWDAIWGFVSMDENMIVQGVYFDHKGETPGLGANIKERFFMDDFIGEHLFDSTGNFKSIDISKSNGDPENNEKADNEVDAIAGATITGNGVSAMLKTDLALYVPYFQSLKQ